MTVELLRDSHLRRNRFTFASEVYENWVILCVSEGAFHYTVGRDESTGDGDAGEARFGDVIVAPPGYRLGRRVVSLEMVLHFWEFQADDAGMRVGILPSPGKTTIRGDDRERLAATLQAAFAPVGDLSSAEAGHFWRDHLLRDLLFLCHRTRGETVADALMVRAAELLRERGTDRDFGTTQLAGLLRLSPLSMTRRFARAHGATPAAYLSVWRLRQVQTRLLSTDDTIDAIARDCGYRDGFYLCRVFQQKLGIAPSDYRRQNST